MPHENQKGNNMTAEENIQLLKTKDDPAPVSLNYCESGKTEGPEFSVVGESTWGEKDKILKPQDIRKRIEPWLTSLVQSEHLSLLIGSGLTQAVHHAATGEKMKGMEKVEFNAFENEIAVEVERIVKIRDRDEGNFEDQIRVAAELLRGLQILETKGHEKNSEDLNKKIKELESEIEIKLQKMATSILEGERNLYMSNEKIEAISLLVSFLMSFASRSGSRERLHIFTTNYDRYIEIGSDMAGLRLIDRFVGTIEPIFRSSRMDVDMHYNPPGLRGEPRYIEGVARFTKLHGSVDWIDCGNSIKRLGVPFGASDLAPYFNADKSNMTKTSQLLIYPNAAKDRETAFYPYVELFRDFATAICRPNSTLICYGYGFGDDHINRVIKDMLTIPSTHIVVILYDDPVERVSSVYDSLLRSSQITLLSGDHLGDIKNLVKYYLPKPSIDRISIKMSELLKNRFNENDMLESQIQNTPSSER